MTATDAIPDLCARRAALTPGKTALHELVSGRRLTCADLASRAGRAAGLLARLGVGCEDRVAVLCRNRNEFFELLFACARLGAVLVPLNWRMPAAELSPLLDHAEPKVLLFGTEDATVAADLARNGMDSLSLDDDTADGYPARRNAAPTVIGREAWPMRECWYLLYTSGTTGRPKAVIQTYGMALANYVNIRQAMRIGPDDVTLNYLPLFHTAGINLITLPTLFEGGSALVLPGFDADRVMALLTDGALDTFFAVPAVYQQLSLMPGFDTLDPGRVRNLGCGGAPMPEALLRQYLAKGARVCNGMGMTETGPTVFLMDPNDVGKKIGSVGKPQLLARVRLVGTDGKDVPDGESGELWFAGPGVTPGYWRDPRSSDAAFSDGWLRSGDLAVRDADGDYFILGRIKDMYISGGENVYPAEVEEVLAGHEDILEAAVTGVPDDTWGEVGRAYLLPRPGHRIPDKAALKAWCRERLAAYKVPKQFVAVDDFPRTAAGKIQKHLIAR